MKGYTNTLDEQTEALAGDIIGAAIAVHAALGAGLNRLIYVNCMAYELEQRGFIVHRNTNKSVVYKDQVYKSGVVLELLVNNKIPVVCVASDEIDEMNIVSLLNQMKHAYIKLGLIFNFNVKHIRGSAIRRVINGFE